LLLIFSGFQDEDACNTKHFSCLCIDLRD